KSSRTPDYDIIRRRKSYPKASPRHTGIFRKSMQIDDVSFRQKFRLHLKLKQAGDEASSGEETAKENDEVEPCHDDNK
ncbi:hypothetical protein ACJMK2_034900, partial [Sinanodonta woodiana]